MKKNFMIVILLIVTFLLSGCVKYNLDIKVTGDKKVDLVLISGVKKGSVLNTDEEETKKTEKALKEAGWKIEDYEDELYKGKKYYKHYDNIDKISDKKEVTVDLNDMLENPKDTKYLFSKRVEDGLEIYKSNFIFSLTDDDNPELSIIKYSELEVGVPKVYKNKDGSNITATKEIDGSVIVTTISNGKEKKKTYTENDFINHKNVNSLTNSALKDADLKIMIEVPELIQSNATNIEENKLSWDLTKFKSQNIELEFMIPKQPFPSYMIGICIGLIVVIVGIIAFGQLKKNTPQVETNSIPLESPNVEAPINNINPLISEKPPVDIKPVVPPVVENSFSTDNTTNNGIEPVPSNMPSIMNNSFVQQSTSQEVHSFITDIMPNEIAPTEETVTEAVPVAPVSNSQTMVPTPKAEEIGRTITPLEALGANKTVEVPTATPTKVEAVNNTLPSQMPIPQTGMPNVAPMPMPAPETEPPTVTQMPMPAPTTEAPTLAPVPQTEASTPAPVLAPVPIEASTIQEAPTEPEATPIKPQEETIEAKDTIVIDIPLVNQQIVVEKSKDSSKNS